MANRHGIVSCSYVALNGDIQIIRQLSQSTLRRGRYARGSPNEYQNVYKLVSLAYIRKDVKYRC